jgi:hypothetical protein
MEWLEFNINHKCRLVLTDIGASMYNRRNAETRSFLPNYSRKDVTEGMEVEMQMWEIMRMFGSIIGNGLPVPFHTTIRLDTECEWDKMKRCRWEAEHGGE